MNVIKVSISITPIAGTVGGALPVTTHDSSVVVVGLVVGLLIGMGLIVGSRRLVRKG